MNKLVNILHFCAGFAEKLIKILLSCHSCSATGSERGSVWLISCHYQHRQINNASGAFINTFCMISPIMWFSMPVMSRDVCVC